MSLINHEKQQIGKKCVCVCVAVPRHPSHNQVWEFDIELGATAEDAADDPGQCAFVLFPLRGLKVRHQAERDRHLKRRAP